MKIHALHMLLLLGLGFLSTNSNAQEEDSQRLGRQSDFVDFPGPRRQTPATLPVFSSDSGRGRPRFRQPVIESGEGELIDDGGFNQEPQQAPPRQSFRGSGGGDGGASGERSRFVSRPQFSQDDGSSGTLGGGRPKAQAAVDGLEEVAKEPEVDRLALLLQDSKFSCSTKKPGYYADDGLNCQVFHYCNEGVRHSWMCPDGTLFHQIHLICMAEGGDNICKQSSKFHFVNDYLYKQLEQRPRDNGTIRYANRYFPEEGGEVQPVQQDAGFQDGPQQPQTLQDDQRDFGAPQGGSFRPSQPQSQEQFDFSQPPPRQSSGGGGSAPSRFRPSFDEGQFDPSPPQFSADNRRPPPSHQGGNDDLGSFGSNENQFQAPPPTRVRGRPSGRGQGFPSFSQS